MTERFLTINPYSRSGKKLVSVMGVVMHWTQRSDQTPEVVWKFFEEDCPKLKKYSSAHYIIGQNGNCIRCIPEDERAYHSGSSQIDPKSGKIYTDIARKAFGKYAEDPVKLSPNMVTIGIEMCPVDSQGNFSAATIAAAVELVRSICHKHKLSKEQIFTHNEIVGWKDCPKLWVNNPALFENFKNEVFA